MISVRIIVATDVIDALNTQIQQSSAKLGLQVFREFNRIGQRVMRALKQQPGTPHYPIRWKTQRQRRAFFATNGFGRGIPTVRTGAESQGWDYTIERLSEGGTFTVFNDVPYALYVQGDDAQPFHLDTGWVQAAPLLSEAQEEAEMVITEIWSGIADVGAP